MVEEARGTRDGSEEGSAGQTVSHLGCHPKKLDFTLQVVRAPADGLERGKEGVREPSASRRSS